jgi:hypothetical protein
MSDNTQPLSKKIYQVLEPRKGTIFLDIGGKYPNNSFTGVIFARDADTFSNVQQYREKTIQIRGKVWT